MKTAVVIVALMLAFSARVQANPQSFDAAEEQKVQAYIKKQKAAGVAPKGSSPNWKPGYTCNDLKKYSFADYQECRYYYSVHGRFYPG